MFASTSHSFKRQLETIYCCRGACARIQVDEIGPRTDHAGPSIVILRGIPSAHDAFVSWFQSTAWLRRAVTRLYLLPANQPGQEAEDLDGIVAAIVAKGPPTETLRLQVYPRKSEMAVAVRCHICCCAPQDR
jgi:hypothetical protein